MNKAEQRRFAQQISRPEGATIVVEVVLSQSLLDDPDYDPAPLIAHECEQSARAFYDDPACEYHYLPPTDYDPGPFAYRRTPGDLPKGTVLMMGRVRVKRNTV